MASRTTLGVNIAGTAKFYDTSSLWIIQFYDTNNTVFHYYLILVLSKNHVITEWYWRKGIMKTKVN